MSYDLLFTSNADRDATGRRRKDAVVNEPLSDSQKQAVKKRIAEALVMHQPTLERFLFDYGRLAAKHGISVDEAKNKYRHIELNDQQEKTGIQITLFDDEFSISVPYWHLGDRARDVFMKVWDYLRIIQRESGLPVYDSQIGRTLDLASDFEQVVSAYSNGVRETNEIVTNTHTRSKRAPWWKFW